MDIDKVLDGLVDDVEGRTDNIDAHLAGASDGNGVSVDGLETLLEDGLLTAGGGDLLLALVTVEVFLKDGVDHEARSNQQT